MQLETLATTRLPNHSARIMREMMTEVGIDWVEVAERVKLDPAVFDDPTSELTGIDEFKLQRAFAQATQREPGAWFHIGLRYHILSLARSVSQFSLPGTRSTPSVPQFTFKISAPRC